MKTFILSLFVLLLPLTTWAQGSARLSYSGRLVSAGGTPITGTVDLTVKLYRNAVLACTQTINTVTLANGIFNIELDYSANCETGTYTLVEFLENAHLSGDSVYIEVTDDTTPATYDKQLLTSVPFAMMALRSDIPDGTITGAKLDSMTASVGQVLQWDGATWGPANISGSGTVTNISTGTGLTGGPITTTGTIAIANSGVDTTQIADGAVTTAKLDVGAVTDTNVASLTLNANKLAQSGAAVNQVLKWNGTYWAAANDTDTDSGGTVTSIIAGSGLSGGTITSSGTIAIAAGGVVASMLDLWSDHFDASTTSLILKLDPAGGLTDSSSGVAVNVDNSTIETTGGGVVQLKNGGVTAAKLSQMGATASQVLTWTGAAWAPSDSAASTSTASDVNVLITADNDINGSGEIILQTGADDRLTIKNDGTIITPSYQRIAIERTLPTSVGDAVEIGQFTWGSYGEGILNLGLAAKDTGVSIAKWYAIPIQYDANTNTWEEVLASNSTGDYGGTEDFALDIKVNNSTIDLRVRRTLGTATATLTGVYEISRAPSLGTFTGTNSTSTPAAPGAIYAANYLTVVNKRVGIGKNNPQVELDVNGTIRGTTICDETGANCQDLTSIGTVIASVTNGDIADSTITVEKLSTASATGGIQMVNSTTAERDNMTPSNGMTIYNTDTNEFQYYNGTSWVTSGATQSLQVSYNGGNTIDASGGNAVSITASSSSQLALHLDGALALGTTTPSGTLHVEGDIIFGANSAIACDGTYIGALRRSGSNLEFCNGSGWSVLETSGNVDLDTAYDGVGAGMGRSITSDAGAVQINGSNAADEALEVFQSGNGGAVLFENTGSGHSFRVNDEAADASPFIVTSTGSVGIANATPQAELDVNGEIRGVQICDETGANCQDLTTLGDLTSSITNNDITDGTIKVEKLDTASGTKGIQMINATTAERNNMTATDGMVVYNTDSNILQLWNGTSWADIDNASTASGTIMGTLESKGVGVNYYAATDGIVYYSGYAIGGTSFAYAYADNSTNPTTLRNTSYSYWNGGGHSSVHNFSFTVKRGEYYRVSYSAGTPSTFSYVFTPLSYTSGSVDGNSLDSATGSVTDALLVDNYGNVELSGDIKLGNSTNGCSASNEGALRYNSTDKAMEFCNGTAWKIQVYDVQEGTFTATWNLCSGANCTGTGSINVTATATGYYRKQGKMVFVSVPGPGAGYHNHTCINITGLPFTSSASTPGYLVYDGGYGAAGAYGGTVFSDSIYTGAIVPSTTTINCQAIRAGVGGGSGYIYVMNTGGNYFGSMTGTYISTN